MNKDNAAGFEPAPGPVTVTGISLSTLYVSQLRHALFSLQAVWSIAKPVVWIYDDLNPNDQTYLNPTTRAPHVNTTRVKSTQYPTKFTPFPPHPLSPLD